MSFRFGHTISGDKSPLFYEAERIPLCAGATLSVFIPPLMDTLALNTSSEGPFCWCALSSSCAIHPNKWYQYALALSSFLSLLFDFSQHGPFLSDGAALGRLALACSLLKPVENFQSCLRTFLWHLRLTSPPLLSAPFISYTHSFKWYLLGGMSHTILGTKNTTVHKKNEVCTPSELILHGGGGEMNN